MRLDRQGSRKFKETKKITLGQKIILFTSAGIIAIYCTPFFNSLLFGSNAYAYPNENSTITTSITPNTTPNIVINTPVTPEPPVLENKKVVAISYDDGPTKTITPQILQLLKDNNCTATFFVLGCNAKQYPDIVLNTYTNGNEIGNHGYGHARYSYLSKERIINDLDKASIIITSITNEKPALVRTPYGEINKNITSAIDYPIAFWSIDSNDWRKISINTIINNILTNLKDGSIILLHDTTTKTLTLSKILIPKIKEAGYDIVSISKMFEKNNITLENGKVYSKIKR